MRTMPKPDGYPLIRATEGFSIHVLTFLHWNEMSATRLAGLTFESDDSPRMAAFIRRVLRRNAMPGTDQNVALHLKLAAVLNWPLDARIYGNVDPGRRA